ncbi:MAG: cupin domain-containing protein [Flavobacteriales bacterium]
MKKIDVPVSFEDSRGKIIDLVENEEINAITRITFTKGAVRANHYHKKTYQYNYVVSGKIELVTQFEDGPINSVILGPGDFALTVPMEKHALKAHEDADLLVFTRGPRGGKEYESDTFRLDVPLIK